jgi:hypothetical protein
MAGDHDTVSSAQGKQSVTVRSVCWLNPHSLCGLGEQSTLVRRPEKDRLGARCIIVLDLHTTAHRVATQLIASAADHLSRMDERSPALELQFGDQPQEP